LTTVIILKPGFSLTRQRNTQRIVGTVIGCAASVVFLFFVKSSAIVLAVLFGCMFMAYSLLLINYAAAVVFISAYVLLLYHLLVPLSNRLIGERAIDTVIGCSIAVAISYLFANWEYRLMGPLVKSAIASMREYIDAVRTAKPKTAEVARPGGGASADGTPKPKTPTRLAPNMDTDYRYRLARKTVHVAYANLGQAFRRMLREPKSKQLYVAELNDLLVQSHALASQITAAAPLIATVGTPEPPALQRALNAVRHHLSEAEKATSEVSVHPIPGLSDAADARCARDDPRSITHALDELAVSIEQSTERSADEAQEMKLLVYQCKQMLRSSLLIRKNATAIHLPIEPEPAATTP
jgi:uncharacterized membrane protein YccC